MLFDLHYGALIDEQAGQGDGLAQKTSGIAAHVQNHAIDAARLEFIQDTADIFAWRF